ncbi:AlpA family transcriptional regulator [Collimonas sp. OK607]|uniref:helix-turn-helix transcriptional regulator n=1 Tax=Collimonas sp. OK607 TaxID=1798194 RepID=UPI000B878294|nr:AlpA family transcriptional regulator [Collimonas sp. OK607]
MEQKIIRLPELKKKLGASRSFIYYSIKKGTFPKQISIGIRAVGWLDTEVETWIQSRIALRGKKK